jgi:hypothetical protein
MRQGTYNGHKERECIYLQHNVYPLYPVCSATPKGSLLSAIHDVRLMNPLTGQDLTASLQTQPLQQPIHLNIQVNQTDPRTGRALNGPYALKVSSNDCFI